MSECVDYRACSNVEDFRQCLELQKEVWGFEDIDALPAHLFVVAREIGGQVFGAFEAGGRLVGFVFALPALRAGRSFFHSHMLAVQSEYRNRGLGRALKLMQRDDALARGINLIEWTFDPLEIKNAFFNIERLGAIVRRCIPNRYGISTSKLHAGLPTDRLAAEWWLDSKRVVDALAGVRPGDNPEACHQRISVPPNIAEIKYSDHELAYDIQQRLRREFEQAFSEGFAVTGFDKAGAYLLARAAPEKSEKVVEGLNELVG
jgi:predicted GNAT superfamily acetyltransferase